MILPIEAGGCKGSLHPFLNRMGLARGNDEVLGCIELQHAPHRVDIVGSVAPISLRVQIAQAQFLLQARLDPGHRSSHLAGDKLESPTRRLMIEQDARTGIEPLTLTVVDGDPVPIEFGHPVGTSGIKGGGLRLRHGLHLAKHFTGRGLVEANFWIDGMDGI